VNRAQQILAVKRTAFAAAYFSNDPGYQADFDLAIRRLIDSARLEGAYNPRDTFQIHRRTRKDRRTPRGRQPIR
jgi:hypothetical protein